jgi:hypothetical protein
VHGANAPSEEATLHFIRLALSHALNYGPPQHKPLPGRLDHDAPPKDLVMVSTSRRYYVGEVGNRMWSAVDDGGLDFFPSRPESRLVCHLEAKNKFAIILDGRPIPSDSALAQMTAQALAIYSSGIRTRTTEESRECQEYVSCLVFAFRSWSLMRISQYPHDLCCPAAHAVL